jgi:TfoX/Sxy family transcriptional regulator of competence genes
MAYDVDLADRVREFLAAEPDLVEKRMFGGLAFLVQGHMALAVGSQGGLLLRADPAARAQLDDDPRASPSVMGGRTMANWVHIDVDDTVTDDELNRWVDHGVRYAQSLPPK